MSSTVARLLTGLHFHSFTYDFHLRMLANFLSGRDAEFFKSGYDTNAFLADFLQYYGCRPAYAQNCVYEERLAYKLGFGVRGLLAWNKLVDTHTNYGWKALRLKQISHESVPQRDYVLVSCSQVPSLSNDSLSLRAVLYDMEQSIKQSDYLFVVVYMIQIIPPNEPIKPPPVLALQSSSRVRHESAPMTPLSAMVPFAKVDVEAEQVIVVADIETEKLQKIVNSEGDETTIEGRRRFSSGGVLSATPPVDIPLPKQSNETDSFREPKMPMFPVSPRSIPKEPIVMPIEFAIEAHNLTVHSTRFSQLLPEDSQLPLPIANVIETRSIDGVGERGEEDGGHDEADGYEDDGRTDAERETEIDDKPSRRHRQERAGDIPEEKFAFYVTFVSEKQKMLQQWIEDSMQAYKNDLKRAVEAAERQCRVEKIWVNIVQLPPRTGLQQKQAIQKLLNMTKDWNKNDPWKPMDYALHDTAGPEDLELMCSLVTALRLDEREPLLSEMLRGCDHARLCRFLLCRYGPQQCKFFSYKTCYKKAIVIINPNYQNQLFLVKFNERGQTPVIEVLFKGVSAMNETNSLKCMWVDKAVDEIIHVCMTFLWSEMNVHKG
ncbi:unnamed protein product, partial [Mesorhabditis belari]|uniref:Uncharacterized protein n=1 Tax=Mesorhabditis belari TaxID=2138241 RepID=A0AAF3EZX9_9BILA